MRVRYHASQPWRILWQLGWSCQRPVGRTLERDEAKIPAVEPGALAGVKKGRTEGRNAMAQTTEPLYSLRKVTNPFLPFQFV